MAGLLFAGRPEITESSPGKFAFGKGLDFFCLTDAF